MAYNKKKLVSNTEQTVSTLITPEAQEARMCGLAIGLAEQQLRDGTASSQVIVHYLKLATEKSRRENERLVEEIKSLKAKTEALQSAQRSSEQLQEVLDALRSYSGGGGDDSNL